MGGGVSVLKMSTTIRHVPSACRFQNETHLPRSSNCCPSGPSIGEHDPTIARQHLRALTDRLLNYLPVRVLPHDLTVTKLPVVAPAHAKMPSVGRRAGQEPLGDPEVATDPVPIITVVDIREASEAGRQRL